MKSKKRLDGTKLGYTALLHRIDAAEDTWQEAYGYLGSYYKAPERARFEIRFLLAHYPERYDRWQIEQIVLKDDFRVHDHPDEKIYAEGDNHETQ